MFRLSGVREIQLVWPPLTETTTLSHYLPVIHEETLYNPRQTVDLWVLRGPRLAAGNHGYLNEMVPWLAFPALSPCEADDVWVLVHIL